MSRPVFAYDLGSPYAWLAAERLPALLDAEWLPVLLGGIFRATGRSSWAEGEARDRGIAEIERRARERGLPPVRWPEPWPGDGLRAMRAATYADSIGSGERFAIAAFRLHFAEGVTLGDEAALAVAAERAGLDPAETAAATSDPAVKAQLRENTDRALSLGVFGVPTLVVDGKPLWGDDRLEEAAALAELQQ